MKRLQADGHALATSSGEVAGAQQEPQQSQPPQLLHSAQLPQSSQLSQSSRLSQLQQFPQLPQLEAQLAAWWHANARDLPWRFGKATPWGVLVSEVMSQQTQMSRVVPYWRAWMKQWSTPQELAQASSAEVISMWGRLGYPRRALRLQACAREIVERHGGIVPRTYEELVALPGIGDYTACAVLSFAYGQRVAVLDTNIRRVLVRAFRGEESRGGAASRAERALAQQLLPSDAEASVVWNQALMEVGALKCLPRAVACETCPLASGCQFLRFGKPGLAERRTRPAQRYQGTDRHVRGIILQALREAPRHELTLQAVRALWGDAGQMASCLASLDEDGLLQLPGAQGDELVRLPR